MAINLFKRIKNIWQLAEFAPTTDGKIERVIKYEPKQATIIKPDVVEKIIQQIENEK